MTRNVLLAMLVLLTIVTYSQNFSTRVSSDNPIITENNNKGLNAVVDVLNYDSDFDHGLGTGGAYIIECYAYHSAASLATHVSAGNTITTVRIYLTEISFINTVELRLRSDQSTIIYSQNVPSPSLGWNEIALTTPYTIIASDLYVGYYIDVNSGGYSAGVDAGPSNPNGDWMVYGGTWYHMHELNAALDYNWNIRAVVEGAELPNTDATLSDLTVDGTTVSGFSSAIYTYNVELPYGTTVIPPVSGIANDANATVIETITATLPLSSLTEITITAEDGTTELVYTINFTEAAANNDATLSDLTVDGTTVSGFSPTTYIYYVELPFGTTVIPSVSGTSNDVNATVIETITATLPLSSSTEITVTAEDGTTELNYIINFTEATSIDIYEEIQVEIYPNPSHGNVMVSGEFETIQVFDITGKKVNATIIDNQILGLSAGVYIVVVDQLTRIKLLVK